MHNNSIILNYDTEKFPFAKVLAALVFKCRDLPYLHRDFQSKKGSALEYDDNLKLRNLMQQLADDHVFYRIYHSWIRTMLSPQFANRISYSAHPKMRVHLAGTGSVSSYHRDADITRRELQINCYLPFTDVYETNTLWVEEEYNSEKYQPVNLKYGQAILWDGGFLRHGTVKNETITTRVSCDFRFQPKHPELVHRPWCQILSARPADMAIAELEINSVQKMY